MTQKTITKAAKKDEQTAAMTVPSIDGIPVNFDAITWVDESTGYSPYWNPDEGKHFIARLVSKDTQDPEFIRYLLQAGQEVECAQGPATDAEPVTVKPGGFFTISVYHSLQDLFDLYLETGIRPWMKVTAGKKVPTKKPGRSVFKWTVQVPREAKAAADMERIKLMKAAKEAPQLSEGDEEESDEGANN